MQKNRSIFNIVKKKPSVCHKFEQIKGLSAKDNSKNADLYFFWHKKTDPKVRFLISQLIT